MSTQLYCSLICLSYLTLILVHIRLFLQTRRNTLHADHSTARWALLGMILLCIPSFLAWHLKYYLGIFSSSFFISTESMIRCAIPLSLLQLICTNLFLDKALSEKPHPSLDYKIIGGLIGLVGFLCFHRIWFNEGVIILPWHIEIVAGKWMRALLLAQVITKFGTALYNRKQSPAPKILELQSRSLLPLLTFPACSAMDLFLYFNPYITTWGTELNILTSTLCTMAISAISRSIKYERLLGVHDSTEDPWPANVIPVMRIATAALDKATKIEELNHITQSFFADAFGVDKTKVSFIYRPLEEDRANQLQKPAVFDEESTLQYHIEKELFTHLDTNNPGVTVATQEIVNRHEVEYDTYKKKQSVERQLAQFMKLIKSDIFIPLQHKQSLLGYILIRADARTKKLYPKNVCEEMLLFTGHLTNTLALLQTSSVDGVMRNLKQATDRLSTSHHLNLLLNETVHTFHTMNSMRPIGIISYEDGQLRYANEEGQQLCGVALDNAGHPLVEDLCALVAKVTRYTESASTVTRNGQGESILLQAIKSTNLLKNPIVITVTPTVVHKANHITLTHMTDDHYLLSLETTQAGKFINRLYPSNVPSILSMKVQLLKLVLSTYPIALSMPEEDLAPLLHILCAVTARHELRIFDISTVDLPPADISRVFFGINPLFGQQASKPFFEELSEHGILFIKHLDLLDKDNQQRLLEFITTGTYRRVHCERRYSSRVRILVTTRHELNTSPAKERLLPGLLEILQQYKVTMPSLLTMSPADLDAIVGELDAQHLYEQGSLPMDLAERKRISSSAYVSFASLKKAVQAVKCAQNQIQPAVSYNATATILDKHLQYEQIESLGKEALKEPKYLRILWNKHKSIAKIAQVIGTSRQTVYKYYKGTGILPQKHDNPPIDNDLPPKDPPATA